MIPIFNGLSYHNGQYLILKNVFTVIKTRRLSNRTRLSCKDSSSDFLELLKNETWYNLYVLDVVQIHLIHF
jgi:5'-3' exonuclease